MSEDSQQEVGDRIEPLLPQHVGALRVSWWSYFDPRGLAEHLQRFPGVSFRVNGENQYAIGGYWRGRSEIGLILEVVGSKDRSALVEHMVERFRELRCTAIALSADEANRNAKWYLQEGWQVLDEIVIYTRRDCRLDSLRQPSMPVDRFRTDQIDELLALEQVTFPFLWWSGREDFLNYASLPDVTVVVLPLRGQMAGYASYTLRNRQGYLDRIAVLPAFQGQGHGAELLSFVLQQLDQAGARTVSLNTQVTNHRAQHLYQTYGFTRTNNVERIYGQWLEKPEGQQPSLDA